MTLLVHERMLVFSPALAATIGLEEAILLYQLHDLHALHGDAAGGFALAPAALERLLPFWTQADLRRIAASLAAKGVAQVDTDTERWRIQLHTAPQAASKVTAAVAPARAESTAPAATHRHDDWRAHALAQRSARPTADATPHDARRAPRKLPLPADWQPRDDTLRHLELKNIPRQFALEQVEEFVFFWRERGEAHYAWDSKFRTQVIERWNRRLQADGAAQQPLAKPERNWYPCDDALEILERDGISRAFIDDAIPEFVLYWREHGNNTSAWNSKFIGHIRVQWARYTNVLEHDREPRPIAANWQPREDVYDILRMANIDTGFARELLPEFILFWRDAGTPQRSWNTKFLQHVKYQWATRHHLTGATRAGHTIAAGGALAGPGTAASAFDRLTDRSWASGLVEGV